MVQASEDANVVELGDAIAARHHARPCTAIIALPRAMASSLMREGEQMGLFTTSCAGVSLPSSAHLRQMRNSGLEMVVGPGAQQVAFQEAVRVP